MTTHRIAIPDDHVAAMPADAWHALADWLGKGGRVTALPLHDLATTDTLYLTEDDDVAEVLTVLATDGWPGILALMDTPAPPSGATTPTDHPE